MDVLHNWHHTIEISTKWFFFTGSSGIKTSGICITWHIYIYTNIILIDQWVNSSEFLVYMYSADLLKGGGGGLSPWRYSSISSATLYVCGSQEGRRKDLTFHDIFPNLGSGPVLEVLQERGQPAGGSEQAPVSLPSCKNQFNIDGPQWGPYQILSW